MSEEWHLRGIRSGLIAEAMGVRSTLVERSVSALRDMGLTDDQICERAKPYVDSLWKTS